MLNLSRLDTFSMFFINLLLILIIIDLNTLEFVSAVALMKSVNFKYKSLKQLKLKFAATCIRAALCKGTGRN